MDAELKQQWLNARSTPELARLLIWETRTLLDGVEDVVGEHSPEHWYLCESVRDFADLLEASLPAEVTP
jgi:hypothetical protein